MYFFPTIAFNYLCGIDVILTYAYFKQNQGSLNDTAKLQSSSLAKTFYPKGYLLLLTATVLTARL